MTLIRTARLADAVDVLRQAILANPRATRAYYTLGLVYSDRNRDAEARGAFAQFLTLAPSRYQSLVTDAQRRLAPP